MADYWKSQPRKFCQYCKCWIADNKPSVEFHERGKNHKENVAAKISEIKKKSIDKAKQDERASKQFAAMEEAAMKAYEEDLKRMEREAAGLPEPTAAQPQQPLVKPVVINRPKYQSKTQAKKLRKMEQARNKTREQARAQVWVEGQSDDGHVYYYNTVTGESQWDKPEGFQGQSSASAQLGQTESSSGSPWMEAVSPEGYTYYYNSETGESSWEKPADFPSNEPSGSNAEGESKEEDPSSPQPEMLSDAAPVSQEDQVPDEAAKESKVPKISFRKRKAEPEPSEKEGEDKVSDDAPEEVPAETKKEQDVQSTAADREEKKDERPKPRGIQARRPKTNPYGVWEKIQEEEDPYASVDLQLPQVEASSAAAAPADLPPEPKAKFKERVITSLGEEGGPASFKRTKTQNGKSRSLRQRDNDD